MSQDRDPHDAVGHQVEEMLLHSLESEWTVELGSLGVLGGI